MDRDLDPVARADDQPERALRHDGLPDLAERVLDRHAPEVHQAAGRDVEVAAEPPARLAPALAALERDGAAHCDHQLLRGEHDADAIVRLDRHDPLLPQPPPRLARRGLVRRAPGRSRVSLDLPWGGRPVAARSLGWVVHAPRVASRTPARHPGAVRSEHGNSASVERPSRTTETREALRDGPDDRRQRRHYGSSTCGFRSPGVAQPGARGSTGGRLAREHRRRPACERARRGIA